MTYSTFSGRMYRAEAALDRWPSRSLGPSGRRTHGHCASGRTSTGMHQYLVARQLIAYQLDADSPAMALASIDHSKLLFDDAPRALQLGAVRANGRRTPFDQRGLNDRGRGHCVRDNLIDEPLQVLDRLQMRSGDKAILAGYAIAFDDLGQRPQNVRDRAEFARNWPNAQPGGDGQAERSRVDRRRIAFDHARFLEALDPFGRARRGQANEPRQFGDADPRVGGERSEDAGVDGVKVDLSISKAFHRLIL